ncbi:uncharacterized protein LOC131214054 isoform X1 [Anopheles bellator]|uniref:uncharacterized protein LOC131214054 isoform X1 n=1 Tax=Anopheles bellator TaxID=139047 RepID=UPI00264734B0|nr:uncharacterized protein LOC131214054 isoform X1 [Anopheles bellator]XP_058064384.1 uncharacterized protein LOC131214054 isoform X1 [Anopheles bellator]
MQLSKILSLALVLGCVVLGSRAAPQANQAADPTKANRNSLLLRRGNVGRPLGRTTATTTTTTTASPDYAEDEYADNYDEGKGEQGDGGEEDAADGGGGKQPTTTTTTTEAPKKIRPSIRPFRSNDDLLSALKKRREESKNSKPAAALPKEKVYDGDEAPAAPKPAKAPAIVLLVFRHYFRSFSLLPLYPHPWATWDQFQSCTYVRSTRCAPLLRSTSSFLPRASEMLCPANSTRTSFPPKSTPTLLSLATPVSIRFNAAQISAPRTTNTDPENTVLFIK